MKNWKLKRLSNSSFSFRSGDDLLKKLINTLLLLSCPFLVIHTHVSISLNSQWQSQSQVMCYIITRNIYSSPTTMIKQTRKINKQMKLIVMVILMRFEREKMLIIMIWWQTQKEIRKKNCKYNSLREFKEQSLVFPFLILPTYNIANTY